jgi:rubrerythrin
MHVIKLCMVCTLKCYSDLAQYHTATEFPSVHHSMDIWHKSKKLRAALLEAGKTKMNVNLVKWADSIVNHFWWCCKECNGNVDELKVQIH